MITNPIIPIWLMSIICIVIFVITIYDSEFKNKIMNKNDEDKTPRQKSLISNYVLNTLIKIVIVVLIFVINLRPMIPNGETTALSSDVSILFLIDTSVSMKALDYNGGKERFEGVVNDCTHIMEELPSCKYSIMTFNDKLNKLIPFTYDIDMATTVLQTIQLEGDLSAGGTSLNVIKEGLLYALQKEDERQNEKSKIIVFLISDGEITMENETLDSFSECAKYIKNGAVLGYGTEKGGKMVGEVYEDDPTSPYYYIYYYDDDFNRQTAISKIDENNLKKIAGDLGVDYIQMSKTSNVDYKINTIKQIIASSNSNDNKINAYQDTYYYYAIPLIVFLIIDLINKKRRI